MLYILYAVIFLIKNQEKKNSNKASLINSILFGPSNYVRRKEERFLDNCHDRMRQIRDHFLRFYKFSQKATIGRSRIQRYSLWIYLNYIALFFILGYYAAQ